MSCWVITGGCGFIGRNFIKLLLSNDVAPGDIRVFDDLSVGTRDDLQMVVSTFAENEDWGGDSLSLWVGDIRDSSAVNSAFAGADNVVHLAACTGVAPSVENPFFDHEQNVLGTLNCLEAARKLQINRFVFASSGAPLGLVEPPIHEKLAPNPASPYAASKLAAEGYCLAYANCFDVKTVILRFGNVYGPYSEKKSSVVAKFIHQALSGEVLEIYGDGSATRDFINVDDLCDAIWRGAHADEQNTGEVYQIATNRETSVREIVSILQSAFEKRGIENVRIEYASPRQGDVPRNFSDITKARERLGWTPCDDLEGLILETLDWHLAHRSGNSTV
jgi:UDP-glucose 4-epimerase